MIRHCFLTLLGVGFFIISPAKAFSAGGTSVVAHQGHNAHVSDSWPTGVGEIVNDSRRTFGWNSWFTEWPNDVNQYAFEIKNTDDLNQLLEKLAAVKAELRQVRLSHLKEPSGLGWVTRAPKDNNIAAIFSIGDQSRIDEWYRNVRQPFGVMEFTAAPVAVPPTLTIFVQNPAVDLDKLKIPDGIEVANGYVPTVFHRSNTKREEELEKAEKKKDEQPTVPTEKLDPTSQAAQDKIDAFLKKTRTDR